jgi:anti-anti-sigma factor
MPRWPSAACGPGLLPERGVDLLTVAMSAREGYTLASLDGEGDVTVRESLCAALTASVTAGAPHLVVDLSRLSFIDCSCLQVLWEVSRVAEQAGGTLVLAVPQPLVARVMELWSDGGQVFKVQDSVATAVFAALG